MPTTMSPSRLVLGLWLAACFAVAHQSTCIATDNGMCKDQASVEQSCFETVALMEGIPDHDELRTGALRNDRNRTFLAPLSSTTLVDQSFPPTSRFESTFPSDLSPYFLHMSANGDHKGWFVRMPTPTSTAATIPIGGDCLKVAKALVARQIVASYDYSDSATREVDLKGPHRLVDENGRKYEPTTSTSRRLHLLLPREAFVHEAVQLGFVRLLDDNITTLTTISLSPRVFLVDPALSVADSDELIAISSDNLQRSGEHHYSPGFENYRTSLTGVAPAHARVSKLLQERVQNITGMSPGGVEQPQLLKYTGAKSWYKKHQDFFHHFESRPVEEVRLYVQTRIRELLRMNWNTKDDSQLLQILSSTADSIGRFDNLDRGMKERIGIRLAKRMGLESSSDHMSARRLIHEFLIDSPSPADDFAYVAELYASELLRASQDVVVLGEADADELAVLILQNYDELDLEDYVPYMKKPVQSNRHVTMLPILQAAIRGGNTAFPNAETTELSLEPDRDEEIEDCKRGLIVKAESGQALMFYNRLPRGDLDFKSTHAGCPPKDGDKIAVNCFTWDSEQRFASLFLTDIDELY